jgi:hypothetical protein
VTVAFDPNSVGAKMAELTFLSNAEDLTVELVGFGGDTATVQTAGDLLVNLDPAGLTMVRSMPGRMSERWARISRPGTIRPPWKPRRASSRSRLPRRNWAIT